MKTKLISRCIVPFFICGAVHAGDHIWNGLGASHNWSAVANWSSGGVPTANESGAVTLIFPSGGFRPNNSCDVGSLSVESIIMNGSDYSLTGTSQITLKGSANSLYSAGTNNFINIPLALSSPSLNFGQSTGSSLRVQSTLSGTGGFKKVGRGELFLDGSTDNTFSGTTTVLGGTLHLRKQSGKFAFSGPLIIGDTAGSAVGGGVDSTVIMDGEQQMPFSTNITVNPDGKFDMDDHSLAITSLTLVGNASIECSSVAPTLTLFGNITCSNPVADYANATARCNFSLGGVTRTIAGTSNLSLYGDISSGGGNAGVIKTGAGTLMMSGDNTYTGDTVVNQGRLYIYGNSPASNIYLKPGTEFSGAATVGNVQSLGCVIEPLIYSSSPAYNLTTKNISIDQASTFIAFMDDSMVGTQALLTVMGTVNLGGCKLEPELEIYGGFNPTVGTKFIIIDNDLNDAVTGTFKELPEGTAFKFSGRLWTISYKGGTGNDVILTVASGQLPLSLDKITVAKDGNWTILTGNGNPADDTYRLESSPDLKVWTDEGTISNYNGNLVAYVSDYPTHKKYFYRFLRPADKKVPN